MVSMLYFRAPEDEELGFPGIAVLGREDDMASYHLFLFFSKFQGRELIAQITDVYADRESDRRDLEECPLPPHLQTRELAMIASGATAAELLEALGTYEDAEGALPVDTSDAWDVYAFAGSEDGPAHAICCLNIEVDTVVRTHVIILYSLAQYYSLKQKHDPGGIVEDDVFAALVAVGLPDSTEMLSVMLWGDFAFRVRCGLREMKRLEDASDETAVDEEVADIMEAEGLNPMMLMRTSSGGGGTN